MPTSGLAGRAARFFFMHLGGLIAIVVYFHVYAASGYSLDGLRSALVTALAVSSGYLALARWHGEHKHFDFAIWIMFAVGTIAAYAGIRPIVDLYRLSSPAILFSTLGLAAVIPPLLGRESFTCYFARRRLPGWQLKTPEFLAVNRVMTAYWAVVFFAAAALCAHAPLDPRFTFVLPNVLVLGLGITAQWLLPALYFRPYPPGLPRRGEPLIMGMPLAFNGAAARDANARIQFHVTGRDPAAYWLEIAAGRCTSFEGITEAPDLTIRTPEDVWVRIAHREVDAQQALAEGLYQVDGDAVLFAKMGEWFGAGR
jgi:putative sterol carrier protein